MFDQSSSEQSIKAYATESSRRRPKPVKARFGDQRIRIPVTDMVAREVELLLPFGNPGSKQRKTRRTFEDVVDAAYAAGYRAGIANRQ